MLGVLIAVVLLATACTEGAPAVDKLTVVPPFWATWWFRGVVALLLVGGAIGGYVLRNALRIRGIRASRGELEAQVADRTSELAALNAVAAVVSRSLDLHEILADALDKTLEVMGIEAGGIYVLDAQMLTIAAHRGFPPQLVAEIDRLRVGEGFSGQVVQSGKPLVVQDISADPRLTRMAVREEGLRSLAVVPLSSRGKVLGTLFVVTRGYREFTGRDVQLLTSIAQQIGVAIENARLFDTVQRRAEQFRVIHEVGRSVTSILAIEKLLDQIAVLIQEAFGYYLVEIGLIEGDELVFLAGAGGTWGSGFKSFRLPVGQQGITSQVAASGEPLLIPDVGQDPRYVRVMPDLGTRSELAIPIKAKDKVIGVLNVESDRPAAFDENDLAVLQSLANQAAIAIENARLFQSEQRRAEQFRVLAEVGRRMTLTPNIQDVLFQVVRLIQQAFGYYHVGIGLVEGDEVVYRVGAGALWDRGAHFQFRPARLKLGEEGLTGWVAATGEPLVVPDVSREPRYVWMQGSETRSELLVPIIVKGRVVGVLDVQSDRLDAFDGTDLAVLQSLAHQTGAAIENAQLYEQAQQAAVMEERQRLARELHDAVTQTLFSASLIAEALPVTWERDQGEGRQLLEELRHLSRGALAEMRTLLLELRPSALVETSLGDLFRQLAEAAMGRAGLPVTVTVEGADPGPGIVPMPDALHRRGALPSDVHVALYRIAQEALNNVVKHARASEAAVSLRYTTGQAAWRLGEGGVGVELRIRDNGRGFDLQNVPPDRLGLGIMRERAQAIGAVLTIQSEIGRGTEVMVRWSAGMGEVDRCT